MSCDVTERARSLFPRLRTKNGSRKNASGQIFVRQRRGCIDACLRSCKKERKIVSVLSLALLGNTFSVLNRIQREELMGWHASGVKRTTDWSYRGQEPITSAPVGV